MTVIIPYTGNKIGLAQLLVSLQPQLHPDDDIYVVDSSLEKSAKPIVLAYGSTRCYIFVEITKKMGMDAVEYGIESMVQNKQEGSLVISEDCVIPATFISSLKRAAKLEWDIIIPNTSVVEGGCRDARMDSNFKWFGAPIPKMVEVPTMEKLDELHCFYIKNKDLKAPRKAFLINETVVVLPNIEECL